MILTSSSNIFFEDLRSKPLTKPETNLWFVRPTFSISLTFLYKDIETKLSVLLEGDVRRFVSNVGNLWHD